MVLAAGATNVEGAVDHLLRRFLRVPVTEPGRRALVDYLAAELDSTGLGRRSGGSAGEGGEGAPLDALPCVQFPGVPVGLRRRANQESEGPGTKEPICLNDYPAAARGADFLRRGPLRHRRRGRPAGGARPHVRRARARGVAERRFGRVPAHPRRGRVVGRQRRPEHGRPVPQRRVLPGATEPRHPAGNA